MRSHSTTQRHHWWFTHAAAGGVPSCTSLQRYSLRVAGPRAAQRWCRAIAYAEWSTPTPSTHECQGSAWFQNGEVKVRLCLSQAWWTVICQYLPLQLTIINLLYDLKIFQHIVSWSCLISDWHQHTSFCTWPTTSRWFSKFVFSPPVQVCGKASTTLQGGLPSLESTRGSAVTFAVGVQVGGMWIQFLAVSSWI